tara:strand:+ start:3386 stop:3937 length:552 start_codon:yes stop_codon:yes gene_type:complete
MTNKQLIQSIFKKDNSVIESLYREYRDPFIVWVQVNHSISFAESKDLFQDAMIILVTKIQNKKIIEITSSLKTFIFGIGKQLIRNNLKLNYNKGVREEYYYQHTNKFDHKKEIDDRYKFVIDKLEEMKNPCKQILEGFYLENLSLKEIAVTLGYKFAESVKVQKHRCLMKLKDEVFKFKNKDN